MVVVWHLHGASVVGSNSSLGLLKPTVLRGLCVVVSRPCRPPGLSLCELAPSLQTRCLPSFSPALLEPQFLSIATRFHLAWSYCSVRPVVATPILWLLCTCQLASGECILDPGKSKARTILFQTLEKGLKALLRDREGYEALRDLYCANALVGGS